MLSSATTVISGLSAAGLSNQRLIANGADVKAGGKEFHYIPCLNERPAWITALADLAVRNLHGWLEPPADAAAREMTLVRAKALGALS